MAGLLGSVLAARNGPSSMNDYVVPPARYTGPRRMHARQTDTPA
ncbi:hypothetical protein ACMGDH_00310 [Sphingomonas sp. DT-207]